MHEFWTVTLGHNILAPISKPRQILDIGCGTGVWAVEVAEEHPNCQIYGIDLSPVQPVYVPDNCDFWLENVLGGSCFHDEKFDLIQSRTMYDGIPDSRWGSYVAEMWRMTKPGGWIQLIEIEPLRYCDDGSMPNNTALAEVERIVEKVNLEKYGITMRGLGRRMMQHVVKAGFTDINVHNMLSPIGRCEDTGISL
jgi:ubiquinone/menaquinone biosynthesis C-methylase UbiE